MSKQYPKPKKDGIYTRYKDGKTLFGISRLNRLRPVFFVVNNCKQCKQVIVYTSCLCWRGLAAVVNNKTIKVGKLSRSRDPGFCKQCKQCKQCIVYAGSLAISELKADVNNKTINIAKLL